ncbi:MAG TPA: hypothetical protein VIK33_07540 [Anaerolineae bacterium]
MMHRTRLAFTFALACATLFVLVSAVRAATTTETRAVVEPASRRFDQGPQLSRIQTVTLESAEPNATNLTTVWENTWVNMDVPFGFPLPSDFTSLTVTGGAFEVLTDTDPITFLGEVFTNSIGLTPIGGGQPLFVSYATDSRAIRDGNTYRIVFHASTPSGTVSSYQTTLLFDEPYDYVGYFQADTLPITEPVQTLFSVSWGPITLDTTNRIMNRDVILIDSRLSIDLAFQAYGVRLSPDRRTATITATVANLGGIETGSLFYIELYDRETGSPAPSGPLDHLGGVCPNPQCNPFRWPNLFERNAKLWPTQTLPITFDYRFQTAGSRSLYLQVDTFGINVGQIPEVNENNNIAALGSVQAVADLYLPIILKNP